MAGILSDKLKSKVEQLQTYVQRKLLDVYGCDEASRASVVAEISARIALEEKVLLGNAISFLSQDYMSQLAQDTERMQRYFDLAPEKKIKAKYQANCDFTGKLSSLPSNKNAQLKAAGMGVLGATTGAFIARRCCASFLSPQVALAALVSAAIYYFATSLLLSNVNKKRYVDAVDDIVGDLKTTILKWLDNIERDFTSIVASI